MKNILLIMDYAAPYRGNFIPSILNLEKTIINENYHLIYLFPISAINIEWIKELQSDKRTIYFINNSFFSKKILYSNIVKLIDIIKFEKIEIIHTHFITYNYTLGLMKLCFIQKVKIVGNFMNEFLPPLNLYYKLKVAVTKLTFDLIIASSESVKQSIIITGIKSKKIITIYNALDIEHLQTNDSICLRNNESQKIILMYGWTFHRKGVDIAINAIKGLIEEKINLKLVIAAAGGLKIIKTSVEDLLGELPSWISIIGPTSNVATYYNSADIFLSASREEGFTYSVLEASYCDAMIIVSEIGGHPLDIPLIGKFENENIQQLKEAIVSMLKKNPKEVESINKVQREYVINTYNIDNWSKEIIKIYSQLVRR